MEFLDEDREFRLICEDLTRLYDRADAIRSQIRAASPYEITQLYGKFAVLKECIMEGTEYLQNRIFVLDRFGDRRVSLLGADAAQTINVAEAMGDEDFEFVSDSMRSYGFYHDRYED